MSLTPDQVAHYGDSKQPALIAGFTILMVLGNGAVLTRIALQAKLAKGLIVEDYLILLAMVSLVANRKGVVSLCR